MNLKTANKIWGTNIELFRNSSSSTNILHIKKGGVCSWHYHEHKWNLFFVISGRIAIETEDYDTIVDPGQSCCTVPMQKHQFVGLEDSVVIEVMYVEYNHDDIERLRLGFFDETVKYMDGVHHEPNKKTIPEDGVH